MRTALPSLLPLFCLAPAPVMATNYHVAMAGSDANPGTAALPWASIQYAADNALAGDSVVVLPGTYTGFAAMIHSGTAVDPIVFTTNGGVTIGEPCAYNNLDGINVENVTWVTIEGFTVEGMPRAGIRTALSDHVTIRYNTCTANGVWGIFTGFAEHVIIEQNTCSGSIDEHGIYFSNSADEAIIRHNHCFDNNACGIHMNGDASMGGDGTISDAQVHGNILHGNGAAGGSAINGDGVVNSVFYNNLLYDNHASGISLYRIDGGAPSTGNKVWNNTIINASDARWCVNISDGGTGNSLLNNILINQHPWRGSIAITADALTGFTSDHNIVVNSLSPDGDATILDLAGWQALGHDANSLVANPMAVMFLDPDGGDFQAVDPNAQQVDAGSNAAASLMTDDLEGNPRPMGLAFDIGSHEAGFATEVGAYAPTAPELVMQEDRLILSGTTTGSRFELIDATGRALAGGNVTADPQIIRTPVCASVLLVKVTRSDGSAWVGRVAVR